MISGRNCGSCTACCTVKAIAAESLIKAHGLTCPNCDKSGCAIYETRPDPCRTYMCAYLSTDWFADRGRPDRSGVLVDIDVEPPPKGYAHVATIHPFRDPARVLAEPYPELVARLIGAGCAVYLSGSGPPGTLNAIALLNGMFDAAAAAGDLHAVRAGLQHTLARIAAHAFIPFSVADAQARVAEDARRRGSP